MVVDVGDPVAERLVDGVLERLAAVVDRDDGGAEQAHPRDVERLALGVLAAHVDDAVEPSRAAAVAVATPCWPAPGLGDDARLADALGQQGLAEDVA